MHLDAGRCWYCCTEIDNVRLRAYHPDAQDVIQICSEKCLKTYQMDRFDLHDPDKKIREFLKRKLAMIPSPVVDKPSVVRRKSL